MKAETLSPTPHSTALSPFDRFLAAENEVLRSAAVRALKARQHIKPDAVRAALIAALLDEDPDIRSDAMELLAPLALPGDADTIRRSLQGDPVREVKLAAITALARLRDADSVPILRALAVSRAEDQVAWEDEGSDWEDWLDIQTAAIRALGEMQAEEAIDDLVDALFDELGQSVDIVVYQALVQIGDIGVAVLIEILNQSSGVARRRAAMALSEAGAADLKVHKDTLLASDDVQLRLLALKVLDPTDPICAKLAIEDPDPDLRARALRRAASVAPDFAVECLADNTETVQAAAIDCLREPFDAEFHETLVTNMLMWLERAKPTLAIMVIKHLPRLAPNRALGPILQIVDDPDRELEIRVAAAKALAVPALDTQVAMIKERLENPARQVRATLMTVLRTLAERDPAAVELAEEIIAGDLMLTDPPAQDMADDIDAPDAGTPKEGSGQSKIWITPDGEIVERDTVEISEGTSTLDAILADPSVTEPPKMAGETPEESGAKRAKRRAVEGTENLSPSLTCDAIIVFGDFESDAITNAMITRVGDRDELVRRKVWEGLVARDLDVTFLETAAQGFADADPTLRLSAFLILSSLGDAECLAKALTDEDALIRRAAVLLLPAKAALDFIADRDRTVRLAATQRVAQSQDTTLLQSATQQAILAERTDTVADLVATAPTAMAYACARLKEDAVSSRQALIILSAIAKG